MKRASGRAAATSRNTVRPPRPESKTRIVGRSVTTIAGRALKVSWTRISCVWLPSPFSCSLQQFLVPNFCLAKRQGRLIRPPNLALPPLVQLAFATQLSDLQNEFISLSTIYFALVQKD